jgi:predicted TIM-barrel fold metal-dependent hydrolase
LYRPILLDDVAKRHPSLKIIVEHMGGVEFFYEALAVVRNNQNCYAGITWTLNVDSKWYVPHDMLMLLLKKIGSEKVIYGGDYPYPDNLAAEQRLISDIKTIKGWDLSAEEKKNILGGNLEKIISN